MGYKVAVVGATGNVGREMLGILAERTFPADEVVALKPLHERARIRRVVVATYQSVSGTGRDAMDELFTQTRAVYVTDPIEPKKYPKRIAFNVIPQCDVFMEDGYTKEEWKMVAE